ncbi:MAG: calcium/sodium antiporter [Bacteroidales bacterium]|nr:calcium/sodium antiporter [Bacteroidales bacterium]MCF8389972.1 calcium/sodium antiporter [Bacteroidales bacterium]
MLESYLLALLGFVLLIGSGRFLVKASVSLASYFGLSTLIIGITVVAFGTSAPELLISMQAAIKGHPEIALGNVIGSNISNIGLALALSAILVPITVKRITLVFDWPFMMLVTILFFLFSFDLSIDRWEGILFNILLIGFVVLSIRKSKKENHEQHLDNKINLNIWAIIGIILASCVGLVIGSNLLIESAIVVAQNLGISERVISISMIAIGTSLPEISTSIMAAIQKETDISVGNIIGSNIFNILSVLGITAVINPMQITTVMVNTDMVWMLGISFLLLVFMFPMKQTIITRFEGILLLAVYVFYLYKVFSY